MKLDFINELVESRMFQHSRNFQSFDNRQLAELSMVCLLLIYVERNESHIQNYLEETIGLGDFDFIRSSSTDLANVIAVLKNYQDKNVSVVNSAISFPVMQFKNFARQIISKSLNHSEARRLIFAFEDFLKISSSEFKAARRTALDYAQSSPSDRKKFRVFVNNFFNNLARNMDLAVWFRNQS